MKLFITLLLSINLFAGDWGSGGGDPHDVEVKPFPNQDILNDAVELLKKNIQKTFFTDKFKEAFITDLEGMVEKKRFYYVPELFAVGFNRHQGDYTKLVSNGAMTEFAPMGAVYFSKRAVEYDARTLARVIAQEIPHHIFRGRFQKNEIFANNLGTYLVTLEDIPQEPYPAAQIIYEEFDHELRDQFSLEVIKKAQKKYAEGEDVLEVLYFLGHELYKLRGSFKNYHVEADILDIKELKQRFPKTAEITPLPKLIRQKVQECVFAKYEDGPSGVTEVMSEKLTRTFLDHVEKYKDRIKKVYLVEDFYLPATKVVVDCGVGLEDDRGEIYVYKAVDRHEGNQHKPIGFPATDK